MTERHVIADTLPQAYHLALWEQISGKGDAE